MVEILIFLLILSASFNVVTVIRYREAEHKLRILKASSSNDGFEILKTATPEGVVTKCTVIIHDRKYIPIISDMTGIPLHRLADQFDEDEKAGKPCILETKEFKA